MSHAKVRSSATFLSGPSRLLDSETPHLSKGYVLWYILCVFLGISFAVAIVGMRVIDPTNIEWLAGDTKTEYLGWSMYRLQNKLQLPFGYASYLGYPLGEDISYLDSIPILAVIFWPVRNFLPNHFQYLGIYWVICCALQAVVGFRICIRLFHGNRVGSLLGAMFFLIAPPFVNRAYGHFALISHWLILSSVCVYLELNVKRIVPCVVSMILICALAASINPYITFMSLFVISVGLLRSMSTENVPWKYAVLAIIICVGMSILVLMLFGFVRLGESGSYAGWGYGKFAMGLLSPIDPMDDLSLLLKAQPSAIEYPSEGYNYLGLGLISMFILSFSRRPIIFRRLFTSNGFFAAIIVFISLLLSLSLRATFGGHIIYDITAPQPVMNILSAFRASGRLFWPGYYFIVAGIFYFCFKVFKASLFCMVMSLCLVVQILDVWRHYDVIRQQWATSSSATPTRGEAWQELGVNHRHLVVLPAFQCWQPNTPGGLESYWEFGSLAYDQKITVNTFYAGRTTDAQMEYFCRTQPNELLQSGLHQDTAYVFSDLLSASRYPMNGHICDMIDGVALCTMKK